MQHQYWVTKKCVLQKFGGKEDDCIVASDAELDAKLELFRSVAESCLHLQRVIDSYQEKLCNLAHEENMLGKYLKEAGKHERNDNAGKLLSTAGKAVSYTGHQRLTIRTPLVRLHHDVETFRGRAIADTKTTIQEMEKARTEYRAALSWMKAASGQLDPDSGYGLEKFRKAQSQVRVSKIRFDRLMLACLQKVDLLAAARCNMFSHALVTYQNGINAFYIKAADTLKIAASCLTTSQPLDICTVTELTESKQDQDQKTFFNADYSDSSEKPKEINKQNGDFDDLLINGLEQTSSEEINLSDDLSSLLNINWQISSQINETASTDDLLGDFLPSQLMQSENFQLPMEQKSPEDACASNDDNSKTTKLTNPTNEKESAVSWLSLFADLDPLANNNNGSL